MQNKAKLKTTRVVYWTLSRSSLSHSFCRFDPNRFSPEHKENLHNFAFHPFGFAGKRKCIGAELALMIATVCIVSVMRKFKVDMVPGQVVTSEHVLVARPREEIWVTLLPRGKVG